MSKNLFHQEERLFADVIFNRSCDPLHHPSCPAWGANCNGFLPLPSGPYNR